jgi:hypothetical protein
METTASRVTITNAVDGGKMENPAVDIVAWFKRHIGLGTIISGIVCSLIAAVLYEWGVVSLLWPIRYAVVMLWGSIVGAWLWLTAEVSVYRWWYWILMLYLIGTLLAAAALWVKFKQLDPIPRPTEYTVDQVFGVVWRWRWGSDHKIYNLTPFCPKCDRPLTVERSDSLNLMPGDYRFDISCRQHGMIQRISPPYDQFNETAQDEILLKVRNGGWKQVVLENRRRLAAKHEG